MAVTGGRNQRPRAWAPVNHGQDGGESVGDWGVSSAPRPRRVPAAGDPVFSRTSAARVGRARYQPRPWRRKSVKAGGRPSWCTNGRLSRGRNRDSSMGADKCVHGPGVRVLKFGPGHAGEPDPAQAGFQGVSVPVRIQGAIQQGPLFLVLGPGEAVRVFTGQALDHHGSPGQEPEDRIVIRAGERKGAQAAGQGQQKMRRTVPGAVQKALASRQNSRRHFFPVPGQVPEVPAVVPGRVKQTADEPFLCVEKTEAPAGGPGDDPGAGR